MLPSDSNPEIVSQIHTAILAGRKLEAITLYRQHIGKNKSEAEAREFVDRLEAELFSMQPKHPEKPSEIRQIQAAILAGNKIEAIKLYREFGREIDLAEAKRRVELMEADLHEKYPEKFAQPEPPKKKGCLGVLLVGAVVPLALWYFLRR